MTGECPSGCGAPAPFFHPVPVGSCMDPYHLRDECSRCGHVAGGCDRCGRSTILGGTIDGRRYCHTEAEQPSCYTLTLRAREDRCDPARGYHSTPHRGCILR